MATSYYGPRSRENARALLDAAKALGYPTSVVKTTRGGYNAPTDVVESVMGVAAIQPNTVYPAPDEIPVLENDDTINPDTAIEVKAEVLERPNNGASFPAWADYAKSVGIEVTDEDTRNGLIAKVDALKEGSD